MFGIPCAKSVSLTLDVRERTDIQSTLSPFHVAQGYQIRYPDSVKAALAQLFAEYNTSFGPLVAANREWDAADYRYAVAVDGSPSNFAVQIDMAGLSDDFLREAASMSVDEVREVLRRRIFEIENSIAMYQLLERVFAVNGSDSAFQRGWRQTLDGLRKRFGKPIALLAVTDQKHEAIRQSEFGKLEGEPLTSTEVELLSGFDRLMGPIQFLRHLTENGGKCSYLLFVRSSDPVAKLKKPNVLVEHPLLGNAEVRRVIKENAITFNVDDPDWANSDVRRINDTKAYMVPMGMAYRITNKEDLLTPQFVKHLTSGKSSYVAFDGARLSEEFSQYLQGFGVDPVEVEHGRRALRFKPAQGTYGCYGHISGVLTDKDVRAELWGEIRKRGSYVVQPELAAPTITDEAGRGYSFIDRNFLSITGGEIRFMGGFRSLMPLDTVEAHQGRNHGSHYTIWAEIC